MIGSTRTVGMLTAWVLIAIGCGGGSPQDVSATQPDADSANAPIQLAQVASEANPTAGGSAAVNGIVRFDGAQPDATLIRMDADPVCAQQHAEPVYAEDVVVNDEGGLKYVFVYVKDGVKGSYPAPSTPVVLDQTGCGYVPRVLGIQANQPLEIVNSDATLHNVNAKPTANRPFNIAQPVKGMKATKKFKTPEVMVMFKCNVHPWMRAYLGVLDHPFFSVTGDDGAFTITGLPAGTYVLEAWHERYGTATQTVDLAEGSTQSVEFTFSPQ